MLRRFARVVLLLALAVGLFGFARTLGVHTDLASLDPAFRTKVEKVIAKLEADGHAVRVVTTWRDPRRQDLVYVFGRLGSRLGRGPGTMVRGGGSCHNRLADGEPASVAVDLRPRRSADHAEQVRFFRALGRAANARTLRWGGDWKRRDPLWAKDDLGWDPGHVEDARMCKG